MHTLLALSGWGQTHPLDQNCLDNSGFPSGADRRTNFRVRGRSPSDGQSRQLPSQGQEGSRATTKSTSGNASIMPKQHVQTPLAELANRRKKRVEYDQDRNKTSLRKEDRHIRIREERQKAKELGFCVSCSHRSKSGGPTAPRNTGRPKGGGLPSGGR